MQVPRWNPEWAIAKVNDRYQGKPQSFQEFGATLAKNAQGASNHQQPHPFIVNQSGVTACAQ